MITESTDVKLYQASVVGVWLLAGALADHDIPQLIEAIDRADAIGPMVDPTLYRAKSGKMQEDRELLVAALPLWKLGKKLVAMKRETE